jgi:hypothetical protein
VDNIRIDLGEIGWGADGLPQDRNQCRALVNLRVP